MIFPNKKNVTNFKNLFFVKAITKYGVFNNYMISSLSGPNGNLLKMNEGGGRSEGGGGLIFSIKREALVK